MNKSKLLFALTLYIHCIFTGFANGDPVIRYSSLNRVGNPEALFISEIKIVKENIKICHTNGYNCFDINYTLRNVSDKVFPTIDYGFPIDYLVVDEREVHKFKQRPESESIYEVGWIDGLIKDVVFELDGKNLPYYPAKESVRETGQVFDEYVGDSIPEDGINRLWYYTEFPLQPHSEANLNVQYKVYANSEISPYPDLSISGITRINTRDSIPHPPHSLLYRYLPHSFTILYDFSPAKNFGQNSFPILVEINLAGLNKPQVKIDDFVVETSNLKKYFNFFSDDKVTLSVQVFHDTVMNIAEFYKAIEPHLISDTNYQIEETEKNIEITLCSALFVSDIICDIDSDDLESITSTICFIDGREEVYVFQPQKPTISSIIQSAAQLPLLLTITDLHDNYHLWDDAPEENQIFNAGFEKDRFKVRNIKLSFESKHALPIRPRWIKLIDARMQ